jgi:hypothetical protein
MAMNRPPKRTVDNGVEIKPKNKPLQFKRGSHDAFKQANPILLYGQPAFEKDTFMLKVGNGITPYNDLPYIGDHSKPKDGKSAYEIWIEEGHEGTVTDFLESLIGDPGKSAYEIWLSVGHEGTIMDFLIDIQGDSAYEVWLSDGHTGTVTDFLDSLVGESAYEIWIDQGHEGSEEEFLEWLCTMTWVNLDSSDEEDGNTDDNGE